MKIEVSNGEAVDRWTILVIKVGKFSKANSDKFQNIQNALMALNSAPDFIAIMKQISPAIVDELLHT